MPIKENDCAAIYKVLIVGDSGVGKSAILNCLMGREFEERSRPTVGIDFVTKILEADGAIIELRIWDTAGLEDFRSLTRRQFQGAQGVIAVYDVTNRASFDNLEYWLAAIPNVTSSCSARYSYEPTPFIMLGNKADLSDRKKVGIMDGMKMAKRSMAFAFHEVSAKTGKNVFMAIQNLAFTITDINHPKLMKSYHPHLIRPMGTKDDVMNSSHPPLSSSSQPRPSSSLTKSLPRNSSTKIKKSNFFKPKKNKKTSTKQKKPKKDDSGKGGNKNKQQPAPEVVNSTCSKRNAAGRNISEDPSEPLLTGKSTETYTADRKTANTKESFALCWCFCTRRKGNLKMRD